MPLLLVYDVDAEKKYTEGTYEVNPNAIDINRSFHNN